MSDKIRITIEVETDAADLIARVIDAVTNTRQPLPKPTVRLEDTPPAVSISHRIRRVGP